MYRLTLCRKCKLTLPTERPLHSFKKEWRGLSMGYLSTDLHSELSGHSFEGSAGISSVLQLGGWRHSRHKPLNGVGSWATVGMTTFFSTFKKSCLNRTQSKPDKYYSYYYIEENCPTRKGILELTLKPEQSETTHCKSKCQFSKVQFSFFQVRIEVALACLSRSKCKKTSSWSYLIPPKRPIRTPRTPRLQAQTGVAPSRSSLTWNSLPT